MNSHSNESRKGTIAVSLTNYLDSGCIVAGASGLTLWAQEFGLSDFAVGLLGAISANAFGSAIGALIGGNLADRFGRKFIYTYNMLLYMAGTILIIFAQNYFMLFAGFLVTGLSVGAGVPATWTYISETADAGQRAHNIGLSQFAWSLGPAIIFTLGVILSPLGLLGNRILFVTLFIVAFIAWNMQRKLRESADWQQEKERQALADKPTHPYRLLFSSRINIKAITFLVGVYLFWNLVAGAMGFFMPFVYETVGGLSNIQANLLQAVMWALTAVVTYYGFARYGDRVDQRWFYFLGAVLATAAWVVLTFVGMSWAGLVGFVALWGISAGIGAQAFYALWATELFPTRYRSGAQGFMFFLVRGSCGVWSIIFPMLIGDVGFTIAGAIMIGLLVISLLIGTIWTPRTRGRTLAEITSERYGTPAAKGE